MVFVYKCMQRVVITIALCFTGLNNLRAEETANPFDAARIIELMKKAADYQLELQSGAAEKTAQAAGANTTNTKSTAKVRADNGWIRAAFYTGILALYHSTSDEKYLTQAIDWGEKADYTLSPGDQRNADNQCCIQVYSELYMLKKDPRMIEPGRAVFNNMMASPKAGRVDWWWCDALYMAPPALARMAAATGDRSYLTFLNEMYWDTTEFLYDRPERLFYRDASFFQSRTKNNQKVFWSRGNGWVLAGLARLLQYLPDEDPGKPKFVTLYREMADRIAEAQQADGLWRPSLADAEDVATSETSGSSFFTFGLAWGINNGYLNRSKFEPVVRKAWPGLVSAITPEGRLGYVQGVAGAPGAVKPETTHEYAVGAFLQAGCEIIKLNSTKLDFGDGPVEKGWVGVTTTTLYSTEKGYGWITNEGLASRDRETGGRLHRDFITSEKPATFRIDADPGLYRLTLIMGDEQFGDHYLQVSSPGQIGKLPVLKSNKGEYAKLQTTVKVVSSSSDASAGKRSHVELKFDSTRHNWVVNALSLEPTVVSVVTSVSQETASGATGKKSKKQTPTWQEVVNWPDPTKRLVEQFKEDVPSANAVTPTGLTRADYLKLIAGNVDFWKQHQNTDGAVIDPYRRVEFQYSTPCFALAAATLVVHDKRMDLLETAAKAMDWACWTLSQRKGATNHEDFYPPQLAHAFPLLKSLVTQERAAKWEANLRSIDPYKIYRSQPGHGNWNVVALSGEFLFHKLGIRPDIAFVEDCLEGQGQLFTSQWGLYLEGPMAYDHFPRIWAADMIAAGYKGNRSAEMTEVLRRGALTSLFMQSPSGELPLGGRSAHHQWNEAEQALTYEIYASRAKAEGDHIMAAAFKRGAHLALASMQRWRRSSGEMFIVKNRMDPEKKWGYEGYSGHSQYNLLPMAMLSIAWQHAEATEQVREGPAPADVGGYVMQLEERLHKIIANAGGMHIELETNADLHYDATGLVRVHCTGMDPQLGPSDTIIPHGNTHLPHETTTTAAIGPQWKGPDGKIKRLAEYGGPNITGALVLDVQETPQRVAFQVLYQGYFSGSPILSEKYVLTPGQVEVTTELPGIQGAMQMVWPVLSDNGEQKTQIAINGKTLVVSFDGTSAQTFAAPDASGVTLSTEQYANRNGLAKLGFAEFPHGGPMRLIIKPLVK